MTRKVEKGITVINLTEEFAVVNNKYGSVGIIGYQNRYRATIHIVRKKYSIGIFDTIQEAQMARAIAERKIEDGSFLSWFDSLPHGNSAEYASFWNAEFARISILGAQPNKLSSKGFK